LKAAAVKRIMAAARVFGIGVVDVSCGGGGEKFTAAAARVVGL
jgi:hypothetical protein